MYLHYDYFPNLNDEKNLLKDDYFVLKNKKNDSPKNFYKICKSIKKN